MFATQLLVTMACMRTPPDPRIVDLFKTASANSPNGKIEYRLFIPQRAAVERQPLLIWLHGRGEAGSNNRDQLAWLELLFGESRDDVVNFPAYVLAVQCPADTPNWSSGRAAAIDPIDRVQIVLDQLLCQERIDDQRIYLAGISGGASACWELAGRDPERFAAMVPFATTSFGNHRPQRFTSIPIWAFQSTGDGPAAAAMTRQMVQSIRKLGGRAHLTVVDQPDHDCWTIGLRKHGAWRWLLCQRRGAANAPPPSRRPTRDSFRFLPTVITGTVIILAGWTACCVWTRVRRCR